MADFNYFINRQGIQGRKGEKGETGFSPTINVGTDTVDEYKLLIANEFNSFETPNLRGNINVLDNGGTYLRYDKETQQISAQDMDAATANNLGGVRLSTEENITTMSADTVVTPADVADALPLYLEPVGDVTITQDGETSKTKIGVDLSGVRTDISNITADLNTAKAEIVDVQNSVNGKQDKLTAGEGITINESNVISVNAEASKATGVAPINVDTANNITLAIDEQTLNVVDGKLHVNMDELGNEVNELSGRVTATEADITTLQNDVTDLTGAVENKQNKLVSGDNITLTDNADGTTTIAATGGGETYPVEVKNFKVNGTLTNDNEVYSGFSTSNYISVDDSIMKLISKDGNTAIETNIGFVVGSDFSQDYAILCNAASDSSLGSLHITKDGRLAYWDSYTSYKVNKALEFNKKYIAKMITYKSQDSRNAVYVIEDNGYTLDTLPDISQWVGVTGSFRLVDTSTYLIGKNNINQYLNGKIDMTLCNQKVNGTEAWRAVFKDNYPAPLATIEHVGLVKPDGTTITVDQYGTISADVPVPTNIVTTDTIQDIYAYKNFRDGTDYYADTVLIGKDPSNQRFGINFNANIGSHTYYIGCKGYTATRLNIGLGFGDGVFFSSSVYDRNGNEIVGGISGVKIDDTTASTTTTYSSSKIDGLIGDISTVLDNINGEVI